MTKNSINKKNQYKKGELIANKLGWVGIVIENTRGNDPNIVMVEMYGFEHESGSIYTSEIAGRITKTQFEWGKKAMGYERQSSYFKGELIEVFGNTKEVIK